MRGELLVLRLIHVGGGVFWVGTLLFLSFFLQPAAAEAGPAAGPVMSGLQRRKIFVWLPVVGLLVILAGLRLMMLASGRFGAGYFATPVGKTYAGAGLLAIVAFIVGVSMARPAMMRLQALAATPPGEATRAEMAVLQRRAFVATRITAVLLALATAGMALARYL